MLQERPYYRIKSGYVEVQWKIFILSYEGGLEVLMVVFVLRGTGRLCLYISGKS
jgi:hypothetical protein